MTPQEALLKAIELAGGTSAALADKAEGIERQHVNNWIRRGGLCSSNYVLHVARAVAFRVTPHQLRPDLYPNATDGLPKGKKK